ncbi:MAG: hypothetical protein V4607_03905 [Pseudomonadota bacterium]
MVKCRFQIAAEADPLIAVRVFHLISVRNAMPEKFSFEKHGAQIRMTLDMLCRDEPTSRLLECKFLSIPTVNQVLRVVFPKVLASNVDETPAPSFWI